MFAFIVLVILVILGLIFLAAIANASPIGSLIVVAIIGIFLASMVKKG